MLPRAERLSVSEFATVFEHGQVLRHPLLHLRLWCDKRRGACRFDGGEFDGAGPCAAAARAAFAVPKKLGAATARNRLRRRIRERYRLNTLRYDARLRGCDLIFLAQAGAPVASMQQLDEAVTHLLQRAARQRAGRNNPRCASGCTNGQARQHAR